MLTCAEPTHNAPPALIGNIVTVRGPNELPMRTTPERRRQLGVGVTDGVAVRRAGNRRRRQDCGQNDSPSGIKRGPERWPRAGRATAAENGAAARNAAEWRGDALPGRRIAQQGSPKGGRRNPQSPARPPAPHERIYVTRPCANHSRYQQHPPMDRRPPSHPPPLSSILAQISRSNPRLQQVRQPRGASPFPGP